MNQDEPTDTGAPPPVSTVLPAAPAVPEQGALVDGVAESQDLIETPSDEESEEPAAEVDPAVSDVVGKLLDLVHQEGLDSLATEFGEIASVLERTKGLALEADEVYRAIVETQRLRREMERVERQVGLSDADLPRGKSAHRKPEAADAVPYSPTPDHLDGLYEALATPLDRIALMLAAQTDGSDSNGQGDYVAVRDAARAAIAALKAEGADPRAAVFSQERLNAWLTLEFEGMTGSSTLSLRQAKQIMKNALLKHREQLGQREAWLNDPRKHDPPLLDELIREVDRAQRVLGARVDQFPTLFTGEDRELLQKFLPAIDEYCKEVTRFGVSGARSYVSLPSELIEVQEKVTRSGHFAAVREAARQLPATIQRLYLNHWICESLLQAIAAKDKRVSLSLPPGSRQYAGGIVIAITKRHRDVPFLKRLISAINFRNAIAHAGTIWAPKDFERHIQGYEEGIDGLCQLYSIDLRSLMVKKPPRPQPIGEYLRRLEQILLDNEIEPANYYRNISKDDTQKHLQHFVSSRDTIGNQDLEWFFKQEMFNHVAQSMFSMHPRKIRDVLERWARRSEHPIVRQLGAAGVGKLFGRLAWAHFKEPGSRREKENYELIAQAIRECGDGH